MSSSTSFITFFVITTVEVFILSGLPILGVVTPACIILLSLVHRQVELSTSILGAMVGAWLGDIWVAEKGEYMLSMFFALMVIYGWHSLVSERRDRPLLLALLTVNVYVIAGITLQASFSGVAILEYMASISFVTIIVGLLTKHAARYAVRVI